jgi:hypothetical protein
VSSGNLTITHLNKYFDSKQKVITIQIIAPIKIIVSLPPEVSDALYSEYELTRPEIASNDITNDPKNASNDIAILITRLIPPKEEKINAIIAQNRIKINKIISIMNYLVI